jgi:hypothetical protein
MLSANLCPIQIISMSHTIKTKPRDAFLFFQGRPHPHHIYFSQTDYKQFLSTHLPLTITAAISNCLNKSPLSASLVTNLTHVTRS